MRNVSRKIICEVITITWDFYKGVSRVQDIVVLQFYAENYQLNPNFASVIRKCSKPHLTTPESS